MAFGQARLHPGWAKCEKRLNTPNNKEKEIRKKKTLYDVLGCFAGHFFLKYPVYKMIPPLECTQQDVGKGHEI